MSKTTNAFALIHFGSNPVYLELELYFLIMLNSYTTDNIIYLYSTADTPASFVEAVKPYVYECIPYDDNSITFNIPSYESAYTSFNTLRTCNFMFAYKLTDYEKICIVESDLVIMGKIDNIFRLNCPSILYNKVDDKELNQNGIYNISKTTLLQTCKSESWFNGGVM